MKRLSFWRILTFSCRDTSRLGSDALDRRLTLRELAAMRLHRAICGPCRCFGQQMRALDEAWRARQGSGVLTAVEPGQGEGLSEQARERIRRGLVEQTRSRG